MRFVTHGSARAFLERSLEWLLEREAENNLILGIALARAEAEPEGEEPAWFATLEEGDAILGAAFRTPPHMIGLTRLPEDAAPLLARMADDAFPHLPGVVGPREAAEAFAAVWAAGHPVRAETEMQMGIYLLEELVPLASPPEGHLRKAEAGDAELLTPWMEGFERDTGIFSTGAETTVRRLLEADGLYLWEAEGRPVSMAGVSGMTPNGARVGYVYTPDELRGRGYAAAATAGVTRLILERGFTFCFLYTNLADPVSNGIYRRLGYRQVASAASIRFHPRDP